MVSSALWRSVCQSSRLRHRLVAMLAVAVQTPRVSTMTKPSNQYAFAMTATAATAFSALPSMDVALYPTAISTPSVYLATESNVSNANVIKDILETEKAVTERSKLPKKKKKNPVVTK